MNIILDASRMNDRISAHTYLQEVFDFPDHYGQNLDAFWDCLMDRQDLEIRIIKGDEGREYFQKILKLLIRAKKRGHAIVKLTVDY